MHKANEDNTSNKNQKFLKSLQLLSLNRSLEQTVRLIFKHLFQGMFYQNMHCLVQFLLVYGMKTIIFNYPDLQFCPKFVLTN